MKEQTQCAKCGRPQEADAPQGLCPACLMNLAANGQTDALDPSVLREADPSLEINAEASAAAGREKLATLFPQLEILEQLGAGGMGVVYKARQKQLDRLVALKLMHPKFSRDPQFAERFNREARALARLSHPSIVNVYDFGEAGGQFYFIMEYVDGANLQQLIATKSFSAREALAIVPKLCDALQYAHDEGVVHRDIKPANILVDKKGRVKIADFGLAKIAGVNEGHLTHTNQGMGTMMYMAPEQMENAKSVDHRADIYSLGVVFYEMLTGELPMGRFAPPSEKAKVDVRFDEIVMHALERDVGRRYQHVSEVKTDVEEVTGTPMLMRAPSQPVPGDDFLICNPRLPRMAQAITVFALIIAPIMYLLDMLMMEFSNTASYSALVQSLGNAVLLYGGFVSTTVLVVGGIKMRKLRAAAPFILCMGLWLLLIELVMVALLGLGSAMLIPEGLEDPNAKANHFAFDQAVGFVCTLIMPALTILSLIWLHRNRRRLEEICVRIPANVHISTTSSRESNAK